MAPGASDVSAHQSPKQMKTRSALVVEQVVRKHAEAEAVSRESDESLVAEHGIAGAAAVIATKAGLDDAGRLGWSTALSSSSALGVSTQARPTSATRSTATTISLVARRRTAMAMPASGRSRRVKTRSRGSNSSNTCTEIGRLSRARSCLRKAPTTGGLLCAYVSWSRGGLFVLTLIVFCGVTRCGSMPMLRLRRGTRRARFVRRRLQRRI